MHDIGNMRKALDTEQLDLFDSWASTLSKGSIGVEGSFRFKFIIVPTSIGDEITVIDLITKEELDLSMAENW